MKKIIFGSVISAALASATVAMAADLPRRNVAPAAPAYAAPVFTWTGFYAGLNAGYGWNAFTDGGKGLFGNANGGNIGLTGGYNYQIGQYVLGVEGDYNFMNAKGTSGVYVGEQNNLATLRGRLGYAVDRVLLFGTAGYAGASIKTANASTSGTQWYNGYVLGGGLEYAFTNNISAKAEYLWNDLSSKTILNGASTAGMHDNILRAGVNYHF
jgi:outer membrane immunogenic protein